MKNTYILIKYQAAVPLIPNELTKNCLCNIYFQFKFHSQTDDNPFELSPIALTKTKDNPLSYRCVA